MNILNTMDKLHHYRTWVMPQAMRKLGLLSEGYNPKFDRYEHKFCGLVFKVKTFMSTDDIHSIVKPTILLGKSGAQFPFVPTTSTGQQISPKKKFEVVFPKGETRRYSSAEHLARDITKYRHGLTRFGSPRTKKVIANLSSDRQDIWDQKIKKMTGFGISQLGCDPASVIAIRNLRTNACILRAVSSVDLNAYGYRHELLEAPMPTVEVH